MRRTAALALGLTTHLLFVLGTGLMQANLFLGMQLGWGPEGWAAVPWNGALLLQFVLGHSWLLSAGGRRVLRAFVPAHLGGRLDTTVYAALASVQVGLLFGLWAPLPLPTWTAPGALGVGSTLAFGVSAGLLGLALYEAGLGVQLGFTGWTALWRGDAPRYPRGFPQRGLHGLIRHPIYLGFALLLWLGPVWSVDKLLLAVPLTAYCLLGPRRKEARYRQRHGAAYVAYLARTPAFLPWRRPRPAPGLVSDLVPDEPTSRSLA